MAGTSVSPRTEELRGHRLRVRVITVRAALLALGGVLLSGLVTVPAIAENSSGARFCGAPVALGKSEPKKINLVLDDSGSMFFEDKGASLLDRWSKAKYSLEVFAALMGPNDELDVYRLSDFVSANDSRRPIVQLRGDESATARVNEIRQMQLIGQGTPFLAVEEAYSNLLKSPESDKWLVVVTDGKFEVAGQTGLDEAGLRARAREFVENAKERGTPIKIAYLAIGEGVPSVAEDRDLGIYAEQAPTAGELLLRMNDLADRVFGRDAREIPSSGIWTLGDDAVDLEEAIVFVQGEGAVVSPVAEIPGSSVQAVEVVDVSWTENKDVKKDGQFIQATPDKKLQGQVAFFGEIPRGDVQFQIQNAAPDVPVKVFYKPKVTLGYQLVDPVSGEPVNKVEPVAGSYEVQVGFMDSNCNFVESSLLGEQTIDSVQITQNGKLIADESALGGPIDFPKGDIEIALAGTYLDGVPIANPNPLVRNFLPPPFPSEIVAQPATYQVSEMAEFPPAGKQIPLTYVIVEDGNERIPTVEEWGELDPSQFTFDHESNLDFEVDKGKSPGELNLLVRAPDGDVYAADTGNIEVTVRGSYMPGQTENVAEATVPIEVVDDISALDRLNNWFKTIGWKILLALLLLLLLLGYLFKRRFSKGINKRPEITGTPRMVGTTALQDRGKFNASPIRKWLPFVANTATLAYVPAGTAGFRKMKLKAGPKRSMVLTNWKEIAQRDNVEINGTPLNAETRRPPKFGPGATITASTPQMTYELTPNT